MRKSSAMLGMALAVGVAVLGLFGCEGPQGPAGKDGTSGNVLALEGFAPDIKCGTCHTPGQDTTYFVAGRVYQWAVSKHATGGTLERNSATCAGCHTTEGFIQRMNGQAVTDQLTPSPTGCFSCHSPHQRGNFSLRNANPVTVMSNISGVPDAVFDYGKGNQCVQCHQTRAMTPKMPGTSGPSDTLTITTSRWYAHYGVQGQMLMGEGGFQFPGYAYRGNSNHSTNATIRQNGCATCHMVEQTALGTGRAGGHTMNIRYYGAAGDTNFHLVSCQQSGCHGSAYNVTLYKNSIQAIEDSLHVLENLLIQRGWLNPSTLLVNASTTRPLKIVPAVKAGALYNYFFVEHDLSRGMHNTKYAQDLLNSSLQALRTP